MQATKQTHHHHIGAICLLPLLLLMIAAMWGTAQAELVMPILEDLASRAEQKLHLSQTQFRDVQRALTLLTEGQEAKKFQTSSPAPVNGPLSSYERFKRASEETALLKQRIAALRAGVNRIGRKIVHIDLSDQQAVLVEDGEIVARYPVSSGAAETPTPTGTFQIQRKQTLRVSSQDIPYRMPYYMAFTPNQSHGMHALPYLGDKETNSDYWYEALDHIGNPVSHGCVRLLPADAEKLYERVEIGTPVHINV
jgi:lipoprotein-anchoring transpeptidase ErfK/SrfK